MVKMLVVREYKIRMILSLSFILMAASLAEPVKIDYVQAELISEVLSIRPGEAFLMALRLQMDENWHTYWVNPGDSGLPTSVEWKLPQGFKAGPWDWPCPQKFETGGEVTFGYQGEVFLISQITPAESLEPGKKVVISAAVDWLVCNESCIPGRADLSLELPVRAEEPRIDQRWEESFRKTQANLPQSPTGWKLSASSEGQKITIEIEPPPGFKSQLNEANFFPEQPGLIDLSSPGNFGKSSGQYLLELLRSEFSTSLPSRLKGVLILGSSRLRLDVPLKDRLLKWTRLSF